MHACEHIIMFQHNVNLHGLDKELVHLLNRLWVELSYIEFLSYYILA